jgi:hypothetical protein
MTNHKKNVNERVEWEVDVHCKKWRNRCVSKYLIMCFEHLLFFLFNYVTTKKDSQPGLLR